jgi:cell fate (sporulation/competence/biofilm development) regulator YlbF (YheA/YmcA/DUF963 family)
MLASVCNSSLKQVTIDKFNEEYKKLQATINLVNDDTEQITAFELSKQLQNLFESTNELINDPIKTEIAKLNEILKECGTNKTFFEQLNHLTDFVKSETLIEQYEPVNETFVDIYDNQKKREGISFLCPELDKRTGGIHVGKICLQ